MLLQDLSDRSSVLRDDTGVTGKTGFQFAGVASCGVVMIATRQQRGAGGRAKRGGVKCVVFQPGGRNSVERWRLD